MRNVVWVRTLNVLNLKSKRLDGKSAQGTLNPTFPRAGGTLINQGTLMRQMIFTTILVHGQ